MFLKLINILLLVVAICCNQVFAADEKEGEVMDRAQIAAQNIKKWQGETAGKPEIADSEFSAICDNLIYGEILAKGSLSDAQKSLVMLASLTASQAWEELPATVRGALLVGASPEEIREAFIQCGPYVGIPGVKKALQLAFSEFKAQNISLPLANAGTVTEKTRFTDGLAVQKKIFGAETIENMQKNAPANQQNLITNYLSAWCFGDFYTRKVLDVKMRELVTFSAIVSLGGCNPQAQAHAQANLAVGNTEDDLIDALAVMLPLIGYPRTLNGLACVNAVLPKK